MRGAITDVIAARTHDDGGLGRLFSYSLAVHLGVGLVLILMSVYWPSAKDVKANVIEVSLGGSIGARTTGVAPVAARRVEVPVPEPTLPEPIKPAPPPKADTMPTPSKGVASPEKIPEKTPTPGPTPPAAVPPVTGRQVQAGTAAVETGATGMGQGLTQAGGGGTGGVVDLNTFDQVWTGQMSEAIRKQWNNLQPETGWSEVLFVVARDGTVIDRRIVASSGSFLLDQEAKRAVGMVRLPPLPRDFNEPHLRVRLRFNYGVK